MKEFSTYMELLSVSAGKVIIVGDFNLHVDNPVDSDARRFAALLESLTWIKHVKGDTHPWSHS